MVPAIATPINRLLRRNPCKLLDKIKIAARNEANSN